MNQIDLTSPLQDMWAQCIAFAPKLVLALAILVIGYIIAKVLQKVLNSVLEHMGFDKLVERGGIKRILERTQYDASDLLAKVVFYMVMLLVLQFAFGIFGTNPVSTLLTQFVVFLPKIFAALLIVIVASAVAAAVKDILQATLAGLSYGRILANIASAFIVATSIFAALSQIEIAPAIVNGLYYAVLAIIAGSAIVAIGGGGIAPMRGRWEKTLERMEHEVTPQTGFTASGTRGQKPLEPTNAGVKMPVIWLLASALVGLGLCGCAEQRQQIRHSVLPSTTQTAERAKDVSVEKSTTNPQFGPAFATYEEGGIRYTRSSMAFPTGQPESSGLLVETIVPAELLVGQSFEIVYKVSNLTEHPIHMVTVADRVSGSFNLVEAQPTASATREGVTTWQLGTLAAKETKLIRVKCISKDEGAINACSWASYSPYLCQDMRVVKANIELLTKAPEEVLVCEPIPVTLTVKNTGSSALSGVTVTESLPEGLVSDGKQSLVFDAGEMAPAQSRTFTFKATATKTGKYLKTAKVSCAQGVVAEATSATVTRQPILKLACQAPEETYLGRAFDVMLTVMNKGDYVAANTVLDLAIPAGVTVKSVTHNGQISQNRVLWNLSALSINATQQVATTLVSANAGTYQIACTAKGTCAETATADCQTRAVGISGILLEKSDNPDPIQIGETTTYVIKVTNQGTAEDTNVRLVALFPDEITPLSAQEEGKIEGKTVSFPVIQVLAPKISVTYKIVGKGVKAGDARPRFTLTAGGLKSPVIAEESTTVY